MSEVLSQLEIDQLLAAVSNAVKEEDTDDRVVDSRNRRIRIYDFKRPDKFSRNQIRSICMMHDHFARLSTTTLSAKCRTVVSCHVASIDQLTYDEFIRSIPTPTTMSVINMDPFPGNAIMEIDPAITFAIIDRLMGGTGEAIKHQHELTDIEQSIMEGIVVRLLGNMRESWTKVEDIRPKLGQMDTNPQFCQIVAPSEMIVLATIEARIGKTEGMINLCYPQITLEPVMDKLERIFWWNGERDPIPGLSKDALLTMEKEVHAVLFETEASVREILSWRKGTTFRSNCTVMPHKLCIDNLQIAEFEPTIAGINKRVKVTKKRLEMNMSKKENVVPTVDGDLGDIRVQIIVELGRSSATLGYLTGPNFGEGSILELDKLAGEPVDVYANNVKIAEGEVCVVDEAFAIRITDCSASKKDG